MFQFWTAYLAMKILVQFITSTLVYFKLRPVVLSHPDITVDLLLHNLYKYTVHITLLPITFGAVFAALVYLVG